VRSIDKEFDLKLISNKFLHTINDENQIIGEDLKYLSENN
jgi:hypothetical protein